jgi:hypothetical protein
MVGTRQWWCAALAAASNFCSWPADMHCCWQPTMLMRKAVSRGP